VKHEFLSLFSRDAAEMSAESHWHGGLRSAVTETIIVLTTVPEGEAGEAIATALVEERLAACVNVLPPMRSIYRWQKVVERAVERQVLIKTTRAHLAAIETRLRALHTYELPELLVLEVTGGNPAYLDWIRSETTR
jgi:periplasmic divalent cation tolerance protein